MNKNIDFSNLGFSYTKTNYSYISYYKDGKWDDGQLTESDKLTISASSPCLHYGQQGFEGMKAYLSKDGRILLFRPDLNAIRMNNTCNRLLMPEIPIDKFIEAVKRIVNANREFVPPYGSNATLYIRPYIIGVGDNLGVKSATEFIFGIFVSPVGPYFKKGLSPVNFMVTDFDRAAPNGTGHVKVGGNYSSSLYPYKNAKELGYADCIYLDPATHTKIEEVGSANFFGITKDNVFVTPKSPSILPSITRKSLLHIARNYLNLDVQERDVYINNLDEFKEAGACGTAAVITPIGGILYSDLLHVFHSETEVGPITRKLYDTLASIQFGDIPGPDGWVWEI